MTAAKHIIIFASGTGTNAEHIIRTFADNPSIRVKAVFCNNPKAGVIDRAKQLHIPVELFDKPTFLDKTAFLQQLEIYQPDLLVLAGFLWLIPSYLIEYFPNRIINIHPSLLPKYGGKGMYGNNVHEAVLAAHETEHGITIHFVNEKYDDGQIIFQAKFGVPPNATLNEITTQIHHLEKRYFPEAIMRILQKGT